MANLKERLKNISRNFGINSDYFKAERTVEKPQPIESKSNTSAIKKNSGPKLVSIMEKNSLETLKEEVKKQKPKRTIIRQCQYCLQPFEALRSDRKHCSNSHKQMAHKKKYKRIYYENAPEHILAEAMTYFIRRIMDHEGELLRKSTLNVWITEANVVNWLLVSKLGENNKYVDLFTESLYRFYGELSMKLKNTGLDEISYTIPVDYKTKWTEFLQFHTGGRL